MDEDNTQTKVSVAPPDLNGLTEGQQKFLDLVEDGENVYLAGLGGAGKSYVLERLIEQARDEQQQVIACAPTGIAALNIGGSTIHRVLNIRPETTLDMKKSVYLTPNSPLKKCDILIVDEISMCRLDLFDYLSRVLQKIAKNRKNSGGLPCQLVVVGDFSQLPPVVPEKERGILEANYGFDIGAGYAFIGNEWDSWDFKKIELTEVIRQRDANFAAALTEVRRGNINALRWIESAASPEPAPNAVYLYGRKDAVDAKNAAELEKLEAEPRTYIAHIEGKPNKSDMPTNIELTLKEGARVMALINDDDERFMNGSLGTVSECKPTSVVVEFDNGKIADIDIHTWEITRPVVDENGRIKSETIAKFEQIPLVLAYAITIHKSQGQTFDSVIINPRCWDPGQLYTALSRVRSIEGLHLECRCAKKFLIASDAVQDFYDGKPLVRIPVDTVLSPQQQRLVI